MAIRKNSVLYNYLHGNDPFFDDYFSKQIIVKWSYKRREKIYLELQGDMVADSVLKETESVYSYRRRAFLDILCEYIDVCKLFGIDEQQVN